MSRTQLISTVVLVLILGFGLLGIQAQSDTTIGTVTDIDGNVYRTVTIGTQIWMAENLRTTRYRNGDSIGTTNPATQDISSQPTPKYQWAYAGNDSNLAVYGRLYTWFAVTDSRHIAPDGWRIPTDNDWKILGNFLGGKSIAIEPSKHFGTMYWIIPDSDSVNGMAFASVSAGSRWPNGEFVHLGLYGHYWASTEEYPGWAWRMLNIFEDKPVIHLGSALPKIGWSVRCIKDDVK